EAVSLSGAQAGISADGTFGKGRIAAIEPKRVREEISAGRVVIVAGFQGVSGTETTTLGRGGSDTSAVALAAALGADRCQIFTDVTGVYTADPRVVSDARQLRVIGYEEMLELANQGAQVMQTRAVELGWVNGVTIEVLSSFVDQPGTQIKEDVHVEQRNKVRGLAADTKVAKVTMVAVPDRPGIARSVFDPLAAANINVDMIVQNTSKDGLADISFTVPKADMKSAESIVARVAAEIGAQAVTHDADIAKVSLVGAGMKTSPGIAARMFR
ncbi:MAG: aspartate kinase, partial [Candidatus Limnocylindrus sp.]